VHIPVIWRPDYQRHKTIIVPVAFTAPLHPVKGIVYVNVLPQFDPPEGVPLIVITFADQEAVTPTGKPVGVPIPVAPVVDIVMGVNAVLSFTVGLEDGVPAVHAADVVQGTPVQFSKAAFFQRTLISSKLKEDFRLIPSILSDS